MPRTARYYCKSCSSEVIFGVPDIENADSFGDKVPCSICGKVGCTSAGFA